MKDGDKLTLATNRIYNDQRYYIDVAAFNGMDGFRKIPSGTKVTFPPTDKQ
jgi:hypothetical protein